jgi:hypothetical protein|tara:strand:- start:35 stop:205 length:171 start_codon:yes stop_codon:yes gene_type:complete
MKNITTLVTDCDMWKGLDFGTILRVPDSEAKKAVKNKWAMKTVDNLTLRGENKDGN